MAKALHIVGALIVLLVLSAIFHLIGWEWTFMPLSLVFVIYVSMVLFLSPNTNPVPFSRAANDKLDAYLVYCSVIGKQPSSKEEDNAWIPKLPYSIEVMAAFRRLIDAMRSYSMRNGNMGRFKKLLAEAEGFVKACQANSTLVAGQVLDDLLLLAYPNCPSRDKETLHRVLGHAGQ